MRSAQTLTRSSIEFWDWTLDQHTGRQTWSDRMYEIMGLQRHSGLCLKSFFFVVNQQFWTELESEITRSLRSDWMINVSGSFTNAKGDVVRLWAIGSERSMGSDSDLLVRIKFCATVEGNVALTD